MRRGHDGGGGAQVSRRPARRPARTTASRRLAASPRSPRLASRAPHSALTAVPSRHPSLPVRHLTHTGCPHAPPQGSAQYVDTFMAYIERDLHRAPPRVRHRPGSSAVGMRVRDIVLRSLGRVVQVGVADGPNAGSVCSECDDKRRGHGSAEPLWRTATSGMIVPFASDEMAGIRVTASPCVECGVDEEEGAEE